MVKISGWNIANSNTNGCSIKQNKWSVFNAILSRWGNIYNHCRNQKTATNIMSLLTRCWLQYIEVCVKYLSRGRCGILGSISADRRQIQHFLLVAIISSVQICQIQSWLEHAVSAILLSVSTNNLLTPNLYHPWILQHFLKSHICCETLWGRQQSQCNTQVVSRQDTDVPFPHELCCVWLSTYGCDFYWPHTELFIF